MKLRTRLIVSFFTIILVPVLLAGITLAVFGKYQLKTMEQSYGIEGSSYDFISNTLQAMSRFTKADYAQLETIAGESPSKLEDIEFLNKKNEELKSKYSFLIITKGQEVIFQGSDLIIDVAKDLPAYGESNSTADGGVYLGGESQALIKQIDFSYTDKNHGSIYIITSINKMIPEFKDMLTDMFISVILILVFTSSMLTMWIYRGIITPLQKLKQATQNIRDGNLDFTIEMDTQDEIGELCNDFEEMRQRLKASGEEKIEQDKESKELISNISHDLKTPITAVKGYVEGIIDGVADTPEKMDRYIRTIYNKANEMDLLINELTLYAQIDTNRIPYTFNKINVASYFNDCIEELELDLEGKNIGLAYFNYTEESVQIIADAEQLKRVINNIVGNSVKYLDKQKGFVNIRIKDVGDFIQVEIEDNGKGIANQDLPYIFDRFYRADASRNSSQGGSGIGLSIVKKIIEDHGGKIWATSKETTGTVMYFVVRKYQEVPVSE